jgi:mannose-6-phosphate isomerase-like protein (cupin superfamily)
MDTVGNDASGDMGGQPWVVDVEGLTQANTNFRTTKWTGQNLQMTLMSIDVGGQIGLEVHADHDQFLRIEAGQARVEMGPSQDNLDFTQQAGDDFAIFVPAGVWHNIINIGDKPLKLYSIYAPPEHAFGTVHQTYADDPEHQTAN